MKKVLGVFLLFSLLLSAGTIYANVDPGQNLSDWYKKAFQKESVKLGAATATGIFMALGEVNSFLEESKKSIEDTLASSRDDKVRDAKSGIESYQTETTNSLTNIVAELENANFDDYVDKLNIEEEMDREFEQMIEEVFSNQALIQTNMIKGDS